MADFSVQFAAPQGAGTAPISPVETRVVPDGMAGMISSVGDVISKGIASSAKNKEEEKKNGVVGGMLDYFNKLDDAVSTGDMDANKAGVLKRKEYNRTRAANSAYNLELDRAYKGFDENSEINEAQKKIEADKTMFRNNMAAASKDGFVFHPNMSDELQRKTVEAWQATQAFKNDLEIRQKQQSLQFGQNAEQRAQSGEQREIYKFDKQKADDLQKEETKKSVLKIMDLNMDNLDMLVTDHVSGKSKIPPIEALAHFNRQYDRLEAGIVAATINDPSAGAGALSVIKGKREAAYKLMDPNLKDETDRKKAENEYMGWIWKGKLAAIKSSPEMYEAVVNSSLMPNESMNKIANSKTAFLWISKGLLKDAVEMPGGQKVAKKDDVPVAPIAGTGTKDEEAVLDALRISIEAQNSGKIKNKEAAAIETVKLTNKLLKETYERQPNIETKDLKYLSGFYSSSEFGNLAKQGKLDNETMKNASDVFKIKWEPTLKHRVMDVLSQEISQGKTYTGMDKPKVSMLSTVDIKVNAAGVVSFEKKANAYGGWEQHGPMGELEDAQKVVNQLVRVGAHLEGSTDYNGYWERNRHVIMPGYFVKDLNPGDKTPDGKYRFKGGDARDKLNYEVFTATRP